ncbi:hypothetical protein [Cohnella mopanensis]|uniref:hypothetical protein n=1 Tax=Cohnella mopanensis TaxID=2911966 RepID=UPI001EF7E02C|nr:hypothetical protein [Cohnella mopanensis]
MEKLKKHVAIPAMALAIAILIVMAIYTYRLKDNGEFEIKDLVGSREAIQDVTISGQLRDGVHRTLFRVEKGQISANTEIFRQPKWTDMYRFGGSKRTGDGMEYSIENSIPSYTITARKIKDYYSVPLGSTEVNPSIAYRNPDRQDNSVTYANRTEYGLAKVGDKVYYTVPVSSYFTGSSGIYELKFHEWGFNSIDYGDAFAPRKIVDINLEAKEPDGQSGIEILGLEAVGHRLALLSVENNKLFIRSYDNESGQLLGETSIPRFYLPARQGDDRPEDIAGYYEEYEAYPDADHNRLTLSFVRSSSERDRLHRTILTMDFTDGVKVVDTTNAGFEDGKEDTFSGITYMCYRNGKLFVIKSYREALTEQTRIAYDIASPKHLYIYAYNHSELIYKGELVTELDEDNIQAYNLPASLGGFSYDQMEYRYFTHVVVE